MDEYCPSCGEPWEVGSLTTEEYAAMIGGDGCPACPPKNKKGYGILARMAEEERRVKQGAGPYQCQMIGDELHISVNESTGAVAFIVGFRIFSWPHRTASGLEYVRTSNHVMQYVQVERKEDEMIIHCDVLNTVTTGHIQVTLFEKQVECAKIEIDKNGFTITGENIEVKNVQEGGASCQAK